MWSKNKYLLLIFAAVIFNNLLFSQVDNRTRVVVAGFKDYQHWDTVQYAQNDAREFYNFIFKNTIRSNVQKDTLFHGKEITGSTIKEYVRRIISDTANFDRIIFYFAGHGSTQKINGGEEGFLIMPGAGKNTDLWFEDAIAVSELLPRLSSIASTKKVYVILDACKSNSFSYSSILSASVTSYLNLIVASQKNEFSHDEDEFQHGLFTYYLIEGLKGHADNINYNGKVSLYELEQYLRENITQYLRSKRKPYSQTPEIDAPDMNDEFIDSDPAVYKIIKKKNGMKYDFTDHLYPKKEVVDTLQMYIKYEEFENHLKEGRLIEPYGYNAFDTYIDMNERYPIESVTFDMLYVLNTKLQNTGQKVISKYLSGDQISDIDSIGLISKFLTKSLSLTVKSDNYYNRIAAMQVFSHAVYISKDSINRSIALLEEALTFFPNASYICNELGHLYTQLGNNREAESKFSRALYYTPTWKIPNYNLGILYAKWSNQYDKSLIYFNNAIKTDSNYLNAIHARGKVYFEMKKYKNALNDFEKAIRIKPELIDELHIFIDESRKKLKKRK